MLDPEAIPAIREGFRLQWEPVQGGHVLLYPEGMVRLNEAAAAILGRCDGETPVARITATLREEFDGEDIDRDVAAFLGVAIEQGWITIR